MNTIIIDPNIYEMADCQKEKNNDQENEIIHFSYLCDFIDYIKNNNFKIALSLSQYESICFPDEHPWIQYKSHITLYNAIAIAYQRMINCPIDFELSPIFDANKAANDKCNINHSSNNNSKCYKEFLKQITSAIGQLNDYSVFMGTANWSLGDELIFNINDKIKVIGNINDQNVLYFSDGMRQLVLSKSNLSPTLMNPLPNTYLCEKYKDLQDEMIRKGEDKIAVYRKIVKEVALRNGYVKDKRLSSHNSKNNSIRDIYSYNSAIFISADLENGAIEVFNRSGVHQGEYHYNGKMSPGSKDISGKALLINNLNNLANNYV